MAISTLQEHLASARLTVKVGFLEEGAMLQRLFAPTFVQFGAACLSGVLLAQIFSLEPIWWIAWVAPAPVLAAAIEAPRTRRSFLGLVAGLIGGSSAFGYHKLVSDSLPIAVLILILRGLSWAWLIALSAQAFSRWTPALAVFVLPIAAAGLEVLVTALSPHGSAGSLAYSQMDFLPAIQVASLGGAPAVVFVPLLIGSFTAFLITAIVRPRARNSLQRVAVPVLLVGAVALGFGLVRLREAPDASGPTVVLIAADPLGGTARAWGPFWRVYGSAMVSAARPGNVLVLPEAAMNLSADQADRVTRTLTSFARTRQVTIVIGILIQADGVRTNRALTARSDGTHLWYLKQHLVPGFEDHIRPGIEDLVMDKPIVGTGVAICKDMHFPSLGRAYALAGTQIMLVPALDFAVDAWMSSRITALRGVEGGYAVARAASHGISSVSDRFGHVVAERPSGRSASLLVMRTRVPTSGGSTPYVHFGWLFGWLCAVITLCLLPLLRGASNDRSNPKPFAAIPTISERKS